MSRPRKPNELHQLEGTARADRGTDITVKLDGEVADPPSLINFESGIDRKQIFKVLSDWVIHITGAAKVDSLLLSALVDQYEIYANAKKDVIDRGIMLQGDKGQYVNHSLYNMNTALDKIHKLMREFGMTPATRSQVKASNQMEEDPMDNLMKGV